jgi:hypothetical protein
MKSLDSKLYTHQDNKQMRRWYRNYSKKKHALIKKPKYKVIYANKDQFEALDVKDYRYILKMTSRLQYDTANFVVHYDGNVHAFLMTRVNYIYDRQTHAVYNEIKDFTALEKK